MPSLAPDKTSVRLKHNLSPPDRVACNTNIFHKGGRRWTQTFHISCKGLTFCHHALPGCIFHFQTFGLICVCVCVVLLSNFRTTPSLLWPWPACDYLHYVHGVCIDRWWCESDEDWPPDGYQVSARAAHDFSATIMESHGGKMLNNVKGFQLALPL